jgi:hypothetical protein
MPDARTPGIFVPSREVSKDVKVSADSPPRSQSATRLPADPGAGASPARKRSLVRVLQQRLDAAVGRLRFQPYRKARPQPA